MNSLNLLTLHFGYLGTQFRGWQRQEPCVEMEMPSVESTLAQALVRLPSWSTSKRNPGDKWPSFSCLGRTDSGTHALRQVLLFWWDADVDVADLEVQLCSALQKLDIWVYNISQTLDPQGRPRVQSRDCIDKVRLPRIHGRKLYRYYIVQGMRDGSNNDFAWNVREYLNVAAMQKSVECLKGVVDCAGFSPGGRGGAAAPREFHGCTIEQISLQEASTDWSIGHKLASATSSKGSSELAKRDRACFGEQVKQFMHLPVQTVSTGVGDATNVPMEQENRELMNAEREFNSQHTVIRISMCAEGFLKHMVRNIVGTLRYIGRGKLGTDGLQQVIDRRIEHKKCAPARGLWLCDLEYIIRDYVPNDTIQPVTAVSEQDLGAVVQEIHSQTKQDVQTQINQDVHTQIQQDVQTQIKQDVHTQTKQDVQTQTKQVVHTQTKQDVQTQTKQDRRQARKDTRTQKHQPRKPAAIDTLNKSDRTEAQHVFGNFRNYYAFNASTERTKLLNTESWNHIAETSWQPNISTEFNYLDVGCNEGQLTQAMHIEIRKFLHIDSQQLCVHSLGVDLDDVLISRATQLELPAEVVASDSLEFVALDVMTDKGWMHLKEKAKSLKGGKFNLVSCFSITMWIHLNHGDEGLALFLKRMSKLARVLLLEIQPWKCYRSAKARLRKMKLGVPESFASIQVVQENLVPYITSVLTQDECGFTSCNNIAKTHWDRPLLLLSAGESNCIE